MAEYKGEINGQWNSCANSNISFPARQGPWNLASWAHPNSFPKEVLGKAVSYHLQG